MSSNITTATKDGSNRLLSQQTSPVVFQQGRTISQALDIQNLSPIQPAAINGSTSNPEIHRQAAPGQRQEVRTLEKAKDQNRGRPVNSEMQSQDYYQPPKHTESYNIGRSLEEDDRISQQQKENLYLYRHDNLNKQSENHVQLKNQQKPVHNKIDNQNNSQNQQQQPQAYLFRETQQNRLLESIGQGSDESRQFEVPMVIKEPFDFDASKQEKYLNKNSQQSSLNKDHFKVLTAQDIISKQLRSHDILQSSSFLQDMSSSSDMFTNNLKKGTNSKLNAYQEIKPQILHSNGLRYQKQKLTPALRHLINNSIDCQLCNEQKMYHSSVQCSTIEAPKSRVQIIVQNLERKYLTSREYYNVKLINDIIYNENTHIVSVFKDYLIFDDVSEFLKRYYTCLESIARLPKMYEFYEKCSKVFPNYVSIPENKYMFKNIERKQRLYDEKQRILQEQMEREQLKQKNGGIDPYRLGSSAEKGRHKDRFSSGSQQQNSSNMTIVSGQKLFSSTFVNSVNNIEPSGIIESFVSSRINNSQYMEHLLNSSKLVTTVVQKQHTKANKQNTKQGNKKLEDMNMDELISKFVAKDQSSSLIQTQQSLMEDSQNQVKQKANQESKNIVYEYKAKPDIQTNPINVLTTNNIKNKKEIIDNLQLNNNSKNTLIEQKHIKLTKQNQNTQKYQDLPMSQRDNAQQLISSNNAKNETRPNASTNQNPQVNQNDLYTPAKTTRLSAGTKMSPQNQVFQNNQVQNNISANSDHNIKANVSSGNNSLQNQKVKSLNHQKSTNSLQKLVEQNQSPMLSLEKDFSNPTLVSKDDFQTINKQSLMGQQSIQPGHQTTRGQYISQSNRGTGVVSRDMSKEKEKVKSNLTPQVIQAMNQLNMIQYSQQPKPLVFNSLISSKQNSTKQEDSNEQYLKYLQQQQVPFQQAVLQDNQMIYKVQQSKCQKSQKQGHVKQKSERQNSQNIQQAHSSNIRSVERLKIIEDEIEKDYSKYLNENGITKTAFAKAVNSLRAKQMQSQQQLAHPQLSSQLNLPNNIVLNNRISRTGINSNEKDRGTENENHIRPKSNSQQRFSTNNKVPKERVINSNYEADLLSNSTKNQQAKTARGVRSKGQLSSQNSSSIHRQSKLSPDKNLFINNFTSNTNQLSQFANAQSILSNANQTHRGPLQNSALQHADGSASIRSQIIKNSKNMKIKFPANSNSNGSKVGFQSQVTANTNSSQTQTPKRIKLQKTKSISHMPTYNNNKVQNGNYGSQNLSIKGRQSDAGLSRACPISNDESLNPNNQASGLQFMPQNAYQKVNQNNFMRTSSHAQLGQDMGNIPAYQMENHHQTNQNMFVAPAQHNYVSNCQTGNNATTSIIIYPMCTIHDGKTIPHQATPQMNSPVSHKNIHSSHRGTGGNSNQKTSRNGASQQNYSQKSNGGTHQRSNSSNSNLLISNNSKISSSKGGKRNSMGSNILKKLHNQQLQNQQQQHALIQGAPSEVSKQQMLQMLMAYQNSGINNQENEFGNVNQMQQNLGGNILHNYQGPQIGNPLSQTLKIQSNLNSTTAANGGNFGLNPQVSAKELKVIKSSSKALIQQRDGVLSSQGAHKAQGKVKVSGAGNPISVKQKQIKNPNNLLNTCNFPGSGHQTQRQSSTSNAMFNSNGCGGPNIALAGYSAFEQSNPSSNPTTNRRQSKSGKNTSRGGDSQKRASGIINTYGSGQPGITGLQQTQDALQQMKQFYNYMK